MSGAQEEQELLRSWKESDEERETSLENMFLLCVPRFLRCFRFGYNNFCVFFFVARC